MYCETVTLKTNCTGGCPAAAFGGGGFGGGGGGHSKEEFAALRLLGCPQHSIVPVDSLVMHEANRRFWRETDNDVMMAAAGQVQ